MEDNVVYNKHIYNEKHDPFIKGKNIHVARQLYTKTTQQDKKRPI